MGEMQAFVGNLTRRKHRRSLSPEFQHAFALEVLKTERRRIIALIVVATALAGGLGTVDLLVPAVLDRIWHGRFPVLFMATSYIVFVLLSLGSGSHHPTDKAGRRCSTAAGEQHGSGA